MPNHALLITVLGVAGTLLYAQEVATTPIPDSIRQEDKALLEKLERSGTHVGAATGSNAAIDPAPDSNANARKPAVPPAVAATSPATDTRKTVPEETGKKSMAPKPVSRRSITTVEKRPARGARTAESNISGLEPVAERVPPPERTARPTMPPVAPSLATEFVDDFIESGENDDVDEHLSFYADKVNYFGRSNMPKQAVASDTLRYNQRWPHRSFSREDDPEITVHGNLTRLRFPLRYSVSGRRERAEGRMLYTVELQNDPEGPHIRTVMEEPIR